MSVSNVLAQELIEAGVHFGHRASRWNPKMRPYIHGRRNLIHIIDVRETIRGLLRARKYLKQVASSGVLVLFVAWLPCARSPSALPRRISLELVCFSSFSGRRLR